MKLFRQAYEQDNGLPVGFTEVEYLESTGTQYIDTGLRLTQNNAIEVCYKINSISGFSGVVGARTSASSNNISVNANTGGSSSPFIGVDFNNSNFEAYRARYDERTNDKILAYLDKHIRKISINGSVVVSNNTECNDTVTTQSNCLLFRTPGINGYCDLNIYYCKIYDNDILVRDYIPVVDENNVGFMFDRVTHTAYLNAGSGEFIYGNEIPRYKTRLGFVRQMGGVLRRLPKGFTEVEYLESDSTAYIDTGVSGANNNLKIEMDFSYSKFYSYGYFFSNHESEEHNTTRFILDSTNNSQGLAYVNTRSASGAIYPSNLTMNDKHSLILTKTTCSLDGVITNNPNPPVGTANTKSIVLFNRGVGSYASTRDIGMRCYYFRIYDNNTLVSHFIPCLDASDTPCMYDIVEGKAYYNKGTGNFGIGKKIIPVEYLESTGTAQKISTGVIIDSLPITVDTIISTSASYSPCYQVIIGTVTENQYLLGLTSGNPTFAVKYNNITSDTAVAPIANTKYRVQSTISDSFSTLNINGTEHTTTGTYSVGNEEIGLFGQNYDTGSNRIHMCKLYKGNTLVRDYIPVIDENNIGYMFDKVTHTLFANKGTGTFLYGEKKPARYLATPKVRLEVPAIYKKLNYLESTGAQYINTGIIGTNANMGIDVDWVFSNNNANMCIFSSRSEQISNTLTLFWIRTDSHRMRFDGVNQPYFRDSVNASVSDDIFNFNYKSKTGAVATLTNKTTEHIQTLNVGKLETFSTNPLYLFASRDTAEVYSWIKMYGCKIYDGDVVVRDFIPVLRKSDNKPGMYDKVNQIFYVNAASGVDFNYG